MKSNVIFSILVFLMAACLLVIEPAMALNKCNMLIKGSALAMDQRDDVRLKCLKSQSKVISTKSCLKIANSMEYSNNAEDARMLCLTETKRKISLKDCTEIASKMEYPDTGDDVRWLCIQENSRTISKNECQEIARKMSYPGNTRRALLYCSDEIRIKSSK